MDEAMQQSCFFSHVTVTLVRLNKNETGCCSSIVRPFDSGIRGALVQRRVVKISLNGGWRLSFLTGSAYVDEWQFFLGGKSG